VVAKKPPNRKIAAASRFIRCMDASSLLVVLSLAATRRRFFNSRLIR
jgi:hypothetical protein